MKNLIEKALKETGLDYFYVKRPKSVFPCIVYQYNEFPCANGDNKEETNKYYIYINLITKSNLTELTYKIKEVMQKYGFIKIVINTPKVFDDVDYYQVTMEYTKNLYNKGEKNVKRNRN